MPVSSHSAAKAANRESPGLLLCKIIVRARECDCLGTENHIGRPIAQANNPALFLSRDPFCLLQQRFDLFVVLSAFHRDFVPTNNQCLKDSCWGIQFHRDHSFARVQYVYDVVIIYRIAIAIVASKVILHRYECRESCLSRRKEILRSPLKLAYVVCGTSCCSAFIRWWNCSSDRMGIGGRTPHLCCSLHRRSGYSFGLICPQSSSQSHSYCPPQRARRQRLDSMPRASPKWRHGL